MGKIICAYSGCGKTFYCKDKDNCYDLDSRWFAKIDGWEEVYIECAKALAEKYDYVFLTAHTSSILLMDSMEDLEWWLIYPNHSMKEEIRERLLGRDSREEWVEGLIDFYDKQITKFDELVKNPNKIVLEKGQFLEDVMDIVNSKDKTK